MKPTMIRFMEALTKYDPELRTKLGPLPLPEWPKHLNSRFGVQIRSSDPILDTLQPLITIMEAELRTRGKDD